MITLLLVTQSFILFVTPVALLICTHHLRSTPGQRDLSFTLFSLYWASHQKFLPATFHGLQILHMVLLAFIYYITQFKNVYKTSSLHDFFCCCLSSSPFHNLKFSRSHCQDIQEGNYRKRDISDCVLKNRKSLLFTTYFPIMHFDLALLAECNHFPFNQCSYISHRWGCHI